MHKRALAWAGASALALIGLLFVASPGTGRVSCGAGFDVVRSRCMPRGCPEPLVARLEGGCEARMRVAVPETHLVVGPSDWEAEGQVRPRTVVAGPLWLDAFEATTEAIAGHPVPDPLRAASGLSRTEAAAYCASVGGRLPTEDEWLVAAAGLGGHRYPWGETGAVCRRATFGVVHGPCGFDGTGPDTVGAHTDGDTTHGIHDLSGNVAEWVAADAMSPGPGKGVAKGGSWRSELATELRVWARLELDPSSHDDRVGVRCAYDSP